MSPEFGLPPKKIEIEVHALAYRTPKGFGENPIYFEGKMIDKGGTEYSVLFRRDFDFECDRERNGKPE